MYLFIFYYYEGIKNPRGPALGKKQTKKTPITTGWATAMIKHVNHC